MNEALLRRFESIGPAAVRQWLDSGDLPMGFRADAREWLAAHEVRKTVADTKKIDAAQSTADANWEAAPAVKRANEIAIAALALAGLAIVISIVALVAQK